MDFGECCAKTLKESIGLIRSSILVDPQSMHIVIMVVQTLDFLPPTMISSRLNARLAQ
jgi:hypothetical protein